MGTTNLPPGISLQMSRQGSQPFGIPEHLPPKFGGKQEPLTLPKQSFWIVRNWTVLKKWLIVSWPHEKFIEALISPVPNGFDQLLIKLMHCRDH